MEQFHLRYKEKNKLLQDNIPARVSLYVPKITRITYNLLSFFGKWKIFL